MAESHELNGNSTYLMRWLIGGLGAVIIAVLTYTLSNVANMQSDITQLKVNHAVLESVATQTAKLGEIVRAEQQSRSTKLNEIDLKLAKIESTLQIAEVQMRALGTDYSRLREALAAINSRLDRAKMPPPVDDRRDMP